MDPNILSIIIVSLIVIVFLYREHKKSGRYFGKNNYLTGREKKQLETFKKVYSPISDTEIFPSINSNGYEFEDVALSAQEIPYKPPIPMPSDIRKLKAKQNVKVVIVDKDGDSQRVWVQISAIKYPILEGSLLNSPFDLEELESETKIQFHANHILQIETTS